MPKSFCQERSERNGVNIVFCTCQRVSERSTQKILLQSQTSLIDSLDLGAYYWICLGLTIRRTCGRDLGMGSRTTWWFSTSQWRFFGVPSYDESYLSSPADDDKFAVDWADNGRDILNFLHYFIPASLTDAPLPTCLRRVDPEETKYRLKHGFGNRTLVGIGHSYGGCTTWVSRSFQQT